MGPTGNSSILEYILYSVQSSEVRYSGPFLAQGDLNP